MSKIKVVEFEAKHVREMDLRPSEKERLDADPNAWGNIDFLADRGKGGTIFLGDVILGIIGYLEIWPGFFEVWAFPSIHVKDHPMVYLRTTKRYIAAIENTFKPFRLQTTAFDDDLHTNWMRFLGFKCETPNGMKNYCVLRQTFNMWSKTYGK